MRLLWAGSLAIFAAAIGAGVRGGILANWAADFGFTGAQLGAIGGAGFTGFCFGIIIGGVVVDKIGYGKLVVAAFVFHVLSAFITFVGDQGAGADDRLPVPLHRHVRLRAGERHARSGRQPAGLHAVPEQPHALPEHPPRQLAGGPGGRRPDRLDPRRRHGRELEDPARPVPGADRCSTASRSWASSFPKSEASAKGLSVGEMMRDVGILGALVACFLIGLFFKDQLGGILGFFTGNPFFSSTTWSMLSWAVALGPAADGRRQDQLLDRRGAAVRAVHRPPAGRRGGARHGRLDPEHHRQHPDARRKARSSSSSPRS